MQGLCAIAYIRLFLMQGGHVRVHTRVITLRLVLLSVTATLLCSFAFQEAVYGPDHNEPTEQGAVRKAAAKRKAPEPDPAAEAALAAIDYKAWAASVVAVLLNCFKE